MRAAAAGRRRAFRREDERAAGLGYVVAGCQIGRDLERALRQVDAVAEVECREQLVRRHAQQLHALVGAFGLHREHASGNVGGLTGDDDGADGQRRHSAQHDLVGIARGRLGSRVQGRRAGDDFAVGEQACAGCRLSNRDKCRCRLQRADGSRDPRGADGSDGAQGAVGVDGNDRGVARRPDDAAGDRCAGCVEQLRGE